MAPDTLTDLFTAVSIREQNCLVKDIWPRSSSGNGPVRGEGINQWWWLRVAAYWTMSFWRAFTPLRECRAVNCDTRTNVGLSINRFSGVKCGYQQVFVALLLPLRQIVEHTWSGERPLLRPQPQHQTWELNTPYSVIFLVCGCPYSLLYWRYRYSSI